MTAVLASGIAFSAAGSFRRERQSGLLELLLVSPLSARQLIHGRIWGIGCHYLPAIAVLVIAWIGDRYLNQKFYMTGPWHLLFLNPLIPGSILFLGLYLSLSSMNFILSWLLTWVVAFVIPVLVSTVLFSSDVPHLLLAFILPSIFHLLLIGVFWILLYRRLRLRTFLQADPT